MSDHCWFSLASMESEYHINFSVLHFQKVNFWVATQKLWWKCWKILLKWIIKESNATAENRHNARLKEVGLVLRIHFTGQSKAWGSRICANYMLFLCCQQLSVKTAGKDFHLPLVPVSTSSSPLWRVTACCCWQLFTKLKILEMTKSI